MHILQNISSVQEISFYSRKPIISGSCVLEITSKSERKTDIYTVARNYNPATRITTISYAFDGLINGAYYTLVVKDDVEEIYRGVAFVTDQVNYEKFDASSDDYVIESTFDNELILVGERAGGGGTPADVTLLYDEAEMAALTSAFKICDLYAISIDDVEYSDWYLPSVEEASAIVAKLNIVSDALIDYGYDEFYPPTIESTIYGPLQTNRLYWTSTENEQFPTNSYLYQRNFYGNTIQSIPKVVDENCFLSETECGGLYELFYKFRVRPVRFEAGVDGEKNYGLDGYGGVIAAAYTLNGVDGALIISPTEPKGADTYVEWSDLGDVTTGADSRTDGQANTTLVLGQGG